MANNFQPNPHVVDTVMGSTLMATTPRRPATGPFRIVSIYWLNPATIGDTFVIEDADGNVIKTARCEVANQSQEFEMFEKEVTDYQVTTLGSGTLYIERKSNGYLKSS